MVFTEGQSLIVTTFASLFPVRSEAGAGLELNSHPWMRAVRSLSMLGLLAGSLLLSTSDIVAAASNNGARDPVNGSQKIRTTLSGTYLASSIAVASHDTAAAALYSRQVLQHDPNNNELIERAFISFLADGDIASAAGLAERMLVRDPGNSLSQLVIGVRAISNKQFDRARGLLNRGGRGRQADVTATLLYAWTQAGSGQFKQAIDTVDRLKGEDSFNVIRDLNAGFIADLGNVNEEAERRYRAALQADPRNMRVIDALGRFLARTGRAQEAAALYDGLDKNLRRNPVLAASSKAVKSGLPITRLIAAAKTGAAESLYGLAVAGGRDGDETASLIYLRLALSLDNEHDLAIAALCDIYERLKMPQEANKLYDTMPVSAAFYRTSQMQKALNFEQMEEPDKAVTLLEKLAHDYPDDYEVPSTLGTLYRSRKDFAKAAAAYDKAVDAAKANGEDVSWSLYYYRGIANERIKQWAQAEKDFKQALALQPDQPLVLNYLGYSWVDQNMNLDEAFEMLRKAVEQRPRDGYIVDSLGWAFYRMGRYDEALRFLERALELRASDPTINDHLGDLYWRIGRKIEAGFQWNHARDLKPEPDDLAQILKKIEHGLPDDPTIKPVSEPAKSGNGG